MDTLEVVLFGGRYDGEKDLCWTAAADETEAPRVIVVGRCKGDGACDRHMPDGSIGTCDRQHVAWTHMVQLAAALGDPAQYTRLRASEERVEYVHSEVDMKAFFDARWHAAVGASTGRRVTHAIA
jgi:hypothetical protein